MSYEDERLAILQRVSRGELSPQDGQLEIAMLKVRTERAPDEPGLSTTGGPRWDTEPEAPPNAPFARPFTVNGPIAFAFALPILLIGGMVLVGTAVAFALPTWLVVTLWNPIALANHWATLSFWPTLAVVVVLFALVALGRTVRGILALFAPRV
jgi:hypothetical protein